MRIQTLTLAAVAALALGAAACTPAEQEEAETNAEVAGDRAGEVAAEAGEVIESGAMKAARAVDPATDQRVPAN
jgi:hypothetical protein